jgi:hypothetical protein
MKEDNKTLLIFVSIIVSIMVVVVYFAYSLASWQCNAYAEVTGRQTKMTSQCYVRDQDQWYTMEEYRAIITAKGTVR